MGHFLAILVVGAAMVLWVDLVVISTVAFVIAGLLLTGHSILITGPVLRVSIGNHRRHRRPMGFSTPRDGRGKQSRVSRKQK